MNSLIFGRDQTQGVVNITLKDDRVHLYKESKDGVTCEVIDYAPWVLSPRKLKPYSERLKGEQFYKYITTTTTEKFLAAQDSWNRDMWLPRQTEECFTLCEGVTYFKGLKVEDVSILSFDIETNGLKMNENSLVYLISNTFRKNGKVVKKLFSVEDYSNDGHMIKAWCDWVREMDPSILTGHNIFAYDLPFLAHCHGQELPLGRDGSGLVFASKLSKFRKDGSQQYEYHNARVTGREIIDTFFLSIKYDIARDFPSYGLKPIVKHLGLQKEDRTLIDASKINEYFSNRNKVGPAAAMWPKVKTYAIEDSEDSLKLYDLMIPAYFYLAQSVPKTLQQMINEASGSQLDSLMIRSYLQEGHSQPRTSGKAEFEGAISMGLPGKYNWVCKADIASLYPSVMLQYNIHDPNKDPNNNMIKMLTYFRDERLLNKRLAKETGDKYYDDMQNAQKIMINSMYGFMGAGFLLYNYPKGAAEVTRKGREILLKGVEWATGYTLEKTVKNIVNEGTDDEKTQYSWTLGPKVSDGRGYTLVNVDTDSFSITNGNTISRTAFSEILVELNKEYPELIRWEDDGIYEKVIVLGAKNYVLVKDGKVKLKGSAITDQKKEPALTEMLGKMIKCLLSDEDETLPMIYADYIKEAMNISDINRWAVKKTVTESVLNPKRLTEQKIYEAMLETIRTRVQEGYQEGDKVWVYNAVDGMKQEMKKGELVFYKDGRPKMVPYRFLRDVRLYANDVDNFHYLDRVYNTVKIISNVTDMTNFKDYNLKSNREDLINLTNGQ